MVMQPLIIFLEEHCNMTRTWRQVLCWSVFALAVILILACGWQVRLAFLTTVPMTNATLLRPAICAVIGLLGIMLAEDAYMEGAHGF